MEYDLVVKQSNGRSIYSNVTKVIELVSCQSTELAEGQTIMPVRPEYWLEVFGTALRARNNSSASMVIVEDFTGVDCR